MLGLGGQEMRKRSCGLVQIKKCSKRRGSQAQPLRRGKRTHRSGEHSGALLTEQGSTQARREDPQSRGALRRVAHRLDVAVQEAHGMNGFDGLQDLLAQPQCGAQRESAPRLASAQVCQVPALGG